MNLSGPVERKLRYLDLGNNCISGWFPNMSRFSFLTELKLRKNQLNESIQKGYLQLPYLAVLDLSSNRIEGPVPDLSLTPSLKSLMLNKNMFTGALTESIGGLSNLEVFWIGTSGYWTCPSYNNLSGRVPQSGQALTFDETTYVGNAGLCGHPLNKSCPGDEPHQSPNFRTEDDDKLITRGFYLSAGIGFIVGFWGIFGITLLKKSFVHVLFNKVFSRSQ
ncbi:hypothetical protein ACJIZ3_011119 [Penstemon smallii]|uniref:Uncharacterized protein n=1 Tax=Penstemon smallii TaxID=265156 RepID=A0ABD3UJM2_9LAMI